MYVGILALQSNKNPYIETRNLSDIRAPFRVIEMNFFLMYFSLRSLCLVRKLCRCALCGSCAVVPCAEVVPSPVRIHLYHIHCHSKPEFVSSWECG
ncbi:hypothetical protein CBR_g12872 [Chara braunii]|uniref:Uncharacterized protein n=1 Tax=Chara braunii TaxID=69332 RepID=A0A388KSW5_CHABU|nr:hypothetical protein CBR_g12872 [Chara braunii]|eukprot:GBG73154.1 hypothetical protein CBR_g12872 [Chara braunii]